MIKMFQLMASAAILTAAMTSAHAHGPAHGANSATASPCESQTAAGNAGADAHKLAEPVTAGDLTLSGGAARAMLPGQPVGGGYISIQNNGKQDDRLISASSERSGEVELHEMALQGDVMKMRKLNSGIDIPAGQTVELKPGGHHLMFMKVGQAFKAGEDIPLTLVFEKAGKVDLSLKVFAPSSSTPKH